MRAMIVACAVAVSSAASASDFANGWSVQYRQDVFTSEIGAVAYVSQDAEQFSMDKSQLQVTCGKDGKLVVGYTGGDISFDGNYDVIFRLADGSTKDASFKGTTASNGASVELVSIFQNAEGQIAFKEKSKQGVFKMIGAAKAIEAVRAGCST